MASVIWLFAVETWFPTESVTATATADENVEPAVVLAGCCLNASLLAGATVTSNAVLKPAPSPVEMARSWQALAAVTNRAAVNVAIPLWAFTVVVPEGNVPPHPLAAAVLSVTAFDAVVTVLPFWS